MSNIEDIIRRVAGSMALSGFILTEEDKERIRLCADDPDKVEEIVKKLVEKHKKPTLKDRLEKFYGKPIEEVERIETPEYDWGKEK